jgi:Fe-S cluster assembly scaffold protein SufB
MVWCVEDGSYVEYVEGEDFQDLKQQQVLVEGKSLLHSRLSYYNMHFNYTVYLFIALH